MSTVAAWPCFSLMNRKYGFPGSFFRVLTADSITVEVNMEERPIQL